MDLDDPRAIRTRASILEAAATAIVELGLQGLTMDVVAQRAGISRSTLYRHWSQLSDLLLATAEHWSPPSHPKSPTTKTPKTADPIVQLKEQIEGLGAAMRSEPWASIAAALAECGNRDPALGELHASQTRERRRPAVRAVAKAQAAGLMRQEVDAEWVVSTLAGPLYYHHLVLHEPLSANAVRVHVDQVLKLLAD
jgi:AcrR family transcriptional regulator